MRTPRVDVFLVCFTYRIFIPVYLSGHCLGAIFGTGTNGAYIEKVENIVKLGDSPVRKNGGDMVINTEWGAFDNSVSIPATWLPMLNYRSLIFGLAALCTSYHTLRQQTRPQVD